MDCRGAAHLHGCAAPCRRRPSQPRIPRDLPPGAAQGPSGSTSRRSPGSRGLYRARSKPSSLGPMPQPPDDSGPLSPERPELLEMIAQAASVDSPTLLLDLASSLLSANEVAQQQSPAIPTVQELGIEMLDSVPAETEPLLRIWAEMLGDEIFRRRVHRQLSAAGSNNLPEWIHRADQIRPRRASTIISEVRIE